MGQKSHDPGFHVFLMEGGVMTFVIHCTLSNALIITNGWEILASPVLVEQFLATLNFKATF